MCSGEIMVMQYMDYNGKEDGLSARGQQSRVYVLSETGLPFLALINM